MGVELGLVKQLNGAFSTAIMPSDDLLSSARQIHYGSPGLVQAALGCTHCSFFKQPADLDGNQVVPRLRATDDALQINCPGQALNGAVCADKDTITLALGETEQKKHRMRRAIIKFDEQCQMACVYCGNGDGGDNRDKQGELKNDVIATPTLYDMLSKFHPKEVELTGGEPTLNFDLLLEAIRTSKQFTDHVMINTNMELLYEKRGEKLAALEHVGLSHLHFALHAIDPEVHKQMRGRELANVEKVFAVIEEALANTNLKLIVEFVPMNFNLQEYQKVYEYVKGLRERFPDRIEELEIGRLIPIGRVNETNIQPKMEDVIATLKSVKPTYPVEVFCFGGAPMKELTDLGYIEYECDAGDGMYYFELDGSVLADNFSGAPVARHWREFEPEKFNGIQCPWRTKSRTISTSAIIRADQIK